MNTGKAAGSRSPVPGPAVFVGLERADGVFFFVRVRDIRQVQEHNGRVRLVFGEGTTFMTRMSLSEFSAALHEAGGCYLLVVDAGTVLCQPLAGKPDAGSELFLSRDRNENICTCTGHGLSAGSCGTGSHAGRADKPGVKLAGADKWKMPCPAGNAYC
ncbi:hypothetical protein A9829_21820 [Salmonella enterica]|nr:hypothetical protein [Salmonella enterica]